MCSRSAALVTLRVSATAMNALTLLRSMGRGLYIKSVYQGSERCIGQRVPQCGSVSPGLILSRGNRVLIRRPRCLDKPDRCAQDLLTLGSIIALMQGHTALVMFDLASLLDEATALISITSSFDRHREVLMRGIVRALATFMLFVLAPSVVYAQATLAGVARDTSGAVLPGVTVEAASPVLIEKVRTATTDETGRYTIPDLRPGEYTVTFTLTGFRTIVR